MRAGCCTQWLIYDAYAADQEAQRRAELDSSKRTAAARKGAGGTHSTGDARDASAADASGETVREHGLVNLAPLARRQSNKATKQGLAMSGYRQEEIHTSLDAADPLRVKT